MQNEGELQELGLSAPEAQIYLTLLRNGSLSASAVTAATNIPRSTVYPTLNSLVDKGLIEAAAGYGGQFWVVPPEQALPSLVSRENDELVRRQRQLEQRKQLATEVAKKLAALASPTAHNGETEFIQVLRDPRVIAERFERLQLEAERQIEVFVKAPFFAPQGNATEDEVLRRGVRAKSLYERAVLNCADVKPFLTKWVAQGEEARIYDGELPHKLAIFDRQNILMPLITPEGQGRTVFIRHPHLAKSLGLLFDFLWELSKPISVEENNHPTGPLLNNGRAKDSKTSTKKRRPQPQ